MIIDYIDFSRKKLVAYDANNSALNYMTPTTASFNTAGIRDSAKRNTVFNF